MNKLKYKCLVLDHDDTVVDSTTVIHYPAFVEAMKILRPSNKILSLNEFYLMNFNPGFLTYLINELKMTESEIQQELNIWRDFTNRLTPEFYPLMPEFLNDYHKAGGIICVVSHSEIENIKRDYASNKSITIEPSAIYGWHIDPEMRKPSSYPLIDIINKFNLNFQDLLVVDDLKHGIDMANKVGVHTAGAGWAHNIDIIADYMKKNCTYYSNDINALRKLVLD